jgi:hypothetical protein
MPNSSLGFGIDTGRPFLTVTAQTMIGMKGILSEGGIFGCVCKGDILLILNPNRNISDFFKLLTFANRTFGIPDKHAIQF